MATVTTAAVKTDIVDSLGQPALALPTLVTRGLQANDQAKYLLALLQAARARADDPQVRFSSLHEERLAAGVLAVELDDVVAAARRAGDDDYVVPDVDRLLTMLDQAVEAMLEPVLAGGEDAPAQELERRLVALRASRPAARGEHVSGRYLDSLAAVDRGNDSVHLFVMDAHRALNQLQAVVASETLDGAAVYGLDDADRPLVAALMAGVHETAAARLGHPGLGTTATRAGSRLLIQNDIGATAAHVVVVVVEGLRATVTYTDVHRQRLVFFQDMLAGFGVHWSDDQVRRGGPALGQFHLVTGRHDAPDLDGLGAYLRHLGSRLAFLIDWNRARKRLVTLVPNASAVELLTWAAEAGCGHMAFLSLGGEQLVYDAVELTGRRPGRYGESLSDLLGLDTTVAVLRIALQASADGLREGKSPLLIRDQLRVELLRNMRAAQSRLVDAAAGHASLVVELARTLRSALLRGGFADGDAFVRRAAERAGDWEHQADQIVIGARTSAGQLEGAGDLADLFTVADDAADGLEEALFLLTLLPGAARAFFPPLTQELAGIAVAGTQEYLRAVLIGRDVLDRGAREDMEDFVIAVDRVVGLEHQADQADRAARAALVISAPDFRSLHVADLVCRAMEDVTDALMRSALHLRAAVLDRVGAR